MGNLDKDLEKFLKSDGMRILMESGIVSVRCSDPLSEEEIDALDSTDLDTMSREELEELQDRAEDLINELEDSEPEDEDSQEHSDWEDKLSDIEGLIDQIEEKLAEGEE